MAWTTPGTATAGEVLTASFWNSNVRDNMVELDDFFSGWTTWTPTITGAVTNPNLGSTGVATGGYIKIGRLVIFSLTIGASGSGISAGSGEYTFTVPVAYKVPTATVWQTLATGWVYNAGAGRYMAAMDNFGKTGSNARITVNQITAAISSTAVNVSSEFTVNMMGHYEAAS